MLKCTRRELIASFLGTPLLAACERTPVRQYDGALHSQDHVLGHKLRDGFAPVPTQRRRIGVAIIGSGAAGLSAAWRLERAGQSDFELLELEAEAGGTARAGQNGISRYPWAAHYLPCPLAHAKAVRTLLVEMGIAEQRDDGELEYDEAQLVRAPQERLFVVDRWYEGLYPHAGASQTDSDQLKRFEAEVDRLVEFRDEQGQRAFTVPSAYGSRDPRITGLDELSLAEWCDQRKLDSPRLRFWLEYGTRDDLGATLEQTSAYAGLHYHVSRTTERGASSFLTWPEGNARLVDHLARSAGTRLRTRVLVTKVRRVSQRAVELITYQPDTGVTEALEAEHVVFAVPQQIVARLLEAAPAQVRVTGEGLQSGAWLVANISLYRRPLSRGFPQCWDNVLYGSRSLGYVVATHQSDSSDRDRSVWTWYLPLTSDDPGDDRRRLFSLDFDQCAQLVAADLARAHPDIAQCIERIDVFRWGHAMVRPSPGLYAGDLGRLRAAAQRHYGNNLHFAHTELSGFALFEEAQWHGVRAAEEILRERHIHSESLL